MIQSTLKQFSVQIQYSLLLKEKQGMKREKADFLEKWEGIKVWSIFIRNYGRAQKYMVTFLQVKKLKIGREL